MTILKSFCEESKNIWIFVGTIINVLKIAIPIIIVIFATLDLGKAVIAGKDDDIKAAQKLLIKRLIYGVLIFFVVTIVQTLIALVTDDTTIDTETNGGATSNLCWYCAVHPSDCKPQKNS